MTISQLEAEAPTREDENIFLDDASRKTVLGTQLSKRNPPARNTSRFWFERFLAVIQRQNPALIDSSFLSQIAPSNEGKLLSQLKYLGVVDDQGKPTKILPMLNMVGDDQKKAFQDIAKESYRDLLSEVKVEKAVPDDLVNFFIRKYAFTRDKGINAAKFFLYLTEKGGISVSSDLSIFLSEKVPVSSQPSNGQVSIVKTPEKQSWRAQKKEQRPVSGRQLGQRKVPLSEQELSSIQTVISIKLDKDTPKEYWDRVLGLIGERRIEISVDAERDGSTQAESLGENLDQDASLDSGFT